MVSLVIPLTYFACQVKTNDQCLINLGTLNFRGQTLIESFNWSMPSLGLVYLNINQFLESLMRWFIKIIFQILFSGSYCYQNEHREMTIETTWA